MTNVGGDVGSLLFETRMARGYSVKRLADLSGLSPSAIVAAETGRVRPDGPALEKLAAALGTSSERLGAAEPGRAPRVIRGAEAKQVYESGASSRSAVGHDGELWGVVLRGRLEVSIAEDDFLLESGDSIWCPSSLACEAQNPAEEPAECVWIDAQGANGRSH
ncbi:MAG TPA: helix-turn-helix domain-containing protein [Solirubrobacterales bacterium]|jgi:transcriptional regulator with XRE-family HTH domain